MTTNLKVRIFAFAFFLVINLPSEAKQYFTIEEAQRVLFPSAEIFERQVVKFTAREKADIEKKSGTKVRNLGNYVWMVKKGGKIIGLVVLDFVFVIVIVLKLYWVYTIRLVKL